MNIEDAKIEIVRLRDELSECRAAIKDAAFHAQGSSWVVAWSRRYASLLPNVQLKAARATDDAEN